MKIEFDEDIILPIITGIAAIVITLMYTFCISQSTYDNEATVLSNKIKFLYEENDKLLTQNHELATSDPETIADLKLQLKLVEDGASIVEAEQIVEVSKEAGVSPK